ncbi:MAG TPA: GtrA family protein, partial [Bryobacteraceae bacterium]|nr:GtrA family protein [Bryobacteraceae bacterium]
LVGLGGVAVQLSVLKLLTDGFGLHFLIATVLAVETAVLHNFWWHWKWTWGERHCPPTSLLRFQCTTGLVSIAGNLVGMKLLAGVPGIPLLGANLVAIGVIYVFNFAVSDRYVFRLR